MSQHTQTRSGSMIRLLAPALLLSLAACAMPENDNSATRDMMIRFSELGLPKDSAPQQTTNASCADAVQVAKTFNGTPRPVFSRCPPSRVAAARSNSGS